MSPHGLPAATAPATIERMSQSGAEMILDQLERELPPLPKLEVPSGMIYHYTDAYGLEGILRTGHVWATHWMFMNDRSELRHGRDVVRQVATQLAADREATEAQRELATDFLEIFDKPSVNRALRDTFVASFSTKPDDLGQWRAYGARGAGYCIGLQFNEGKEEPEESVTLGAMLVPCEYDADAALALIKTDLKHVFEAIERYVRTYGTQAEPREIYGRGMVHALRRIARHWLRVKHHTFSDEAEWRYIAGPREASRKDLLKARPTSRGIIPYVAIPLDPGKPGPAQVDRIIVGPTHHPEEGVVATCLLLESFGYTREHAERIVEASKVPFRGV